ncbi:MAG TPA: ATP-binding protein, partial [Dermatophilaceae bacterium]|nr:ATP-binding protein [Dermatophilaceae bacterium]
MNRFLDGLEGRNRGKPLLALWSGHGVPSHNGFLRLLTSDATRFHRHGLAVGDFLPACVATGSSQILLVLDTCHSGAGRGAGVDIAARMLEDAPPDADHAWVGVLASTLPAQQAIDGVFGAAFRKVVRNGPAAASQQLTWRNSRFVTGAQVAQAVTTDWDEEEHRPTFRSDGELSDLLPNPLWHYGRQAGIVEHLLLAARSGATKVEPPAFTGRRFEVDTVVGWVASRTPGLYVVTGLAGTGKSAVVGRVVSLSDPAERKRVLKLAPDLGHADPGEGAVAAHAHARGLTADRLAEALGNALVHRDVLPPSTTGKPYNAALLVGALQQHEGVPPVLVVDGLDEARDHAFAIADDLLTKLAGHACVVVASRDLPGPGDSPSLLDRLDPHGSRLDLSGPEALVRGQDAMGAYVTARLSDRSPVMDPGLVAE